MSNQEKFESMCNYVEQMDSFDEVRKLRWLVDNKYKPLLKEAQRDLPNIVNNYIEIPSDREYIEIYPSNSSQIHAGDTLYLIEFGVGGGIKRTDNAVVNSVDFREVGCDFPYCTIRYDYNQHLRFDQNPFCIDDDDRYYWFRTYDSLARVFKKIVE